MSTRGMIALKLPGGDLIGRYHHNDSYPIGLGKTLWHAYHGPFEQNLEEMMHFFLNQHPAGWSTVVDADFYLEPGFVNNRVPFSDEPRRPQCYCHGDRKERNREFLSKKDLKDFDYSYVFDIISLDMTIVESGKVIACVGLNGNEPNWQELEETRV